MKYFTANDRPPPHLYLYSVTLQREISQTSRFVYIVLIRRRISSMHKPRFPLVLYIMMSSRLYRGAMAVQKSVFEKRRIILLLLLFLRGRIFISTDYSRDGAGGGVVGSRLICIIMDYYNIV